MPFDVAAAIEKLAEAVNSGFRYAEESRERQSESEVIKTNKRYRKAIDAAERLIIMMYPTFKPDDEKLKKRFAKALKEFLENN